MTLRDPLAAEGVVTKDVVGRTLYVRPSDSEGPLVQRLWRQGHQALMSADPSDIRDRTPRLTARVGGGREVCGRPVAGGLVAFEFPPDDRAFLRMAAEPGLRAYVTVDKTSRHILGVSFRGRR